MTIERPPLNLQVTTLWDYPSQQYGEGGQGDQNYKGATPSYIIWNCLQRYTNPNDLVVDPCCGSGTTIDVARDLGRKALGYDIAPARKDIFRADARKLPLESGKADFVFIDPPYSTHLNYSEDPACIGKLSAGSGDYYEAMEQVIREIRRVLKPGRMLALYVSDSLTKGKTFNPIGFELFSRMQKAGFVAVDVIAVTRHNKTLEMGNYRKSAEEENFFLRGFNYLFLMQREAKAPPRRRSPRTPLGSDRAKPTRKYPPSYRRGGNS